jgi:hypothetical protein
VAEVGETITIEASVVLDDYGVKQATIGYGRAKLLVSNVKRQVTYDTLRHQVNSLINQFWQHVESGNRAEVDGYTVAEAAECFVAARQRFAAARKLSLTKAELTLLLRDRHSMPVNERPMYDRYATTRNAMEKAFGVNIEELNAEQYLAFARKVLSGELPNPDKPDRVDQSYLFRLLDQPPFTVAQFVELVTDTLKMRVARLEQTGDSHDEYWDDYYLAEQCLTYLGTIEDPSVIDGLAWMVDYCLGHGYFDNRLTRSENYATSRKFDSYLEKAVRSLADGARYHGVRVPADFDFGRVQTWNNALAAYPFMDHVATQLRQSFTRLFAA